MSVFVDRNDLFLHLKKLNEGVENYDIDYNFDPHKFDVVLNFSQRKIHFRPQFYGKVEDSSFYSFFPDALAIRFSGWRPYAPKHIEFFSNKVELKKFLIKEGFRVPEYRLTRHGSFRDFVAKFSNESFGKGVAGPFEDFQKCVETMGNSVQSPENRYFEQYISGDIVKIWYLNEFPICYELIKCPQIKGNGYESIESIAKRIVHRERNADDLNRLNCMLKWQGLRTTDVLERGKTIIVDFIYGSPYYASREFFTEQDVSLESFFNPVYKLGYALWDNIEPESGGLLVYTVDAVKDENDVFWFLEANSNPEVHPFVYPRMVGLLVES